MLGRRRQSCPHRPAHTTTHCIINTTHVSVQLPASADNVELLACACSSSGSGGGRSSSSSCPHQPAHTTTHCIRVQLPTSADNVALPACAAACRPCRDQSISDFYVKVYLSFLSFSVCLFCCILCLLYFILLLPCFGEMKITCLPGPQQQTSHMLLQRSIDVM